MPSNADLQEKMTLPASISIEYNVFRDAGGAGSEFARCLVTRRLDDDQYQSIELIKPSGYGISEHKMVYDILKLMGYTDEDLSLTSPEDDA